MQLSSARPYPFKFRPETTALVIIDMQRDFLDIGGFGQVQCGNDEVFNRVREVVPTTQKALAAARQLGLQVIHTREGHKPDLSDLPPSKRLRQISAPSGNHTVGIGDQGPMGRLLTQGEYGHDIIDELKPRPGEQVIDKPGKGSFWDTIFHRCLMARGITHLLFAGVTTECCVNSTAREAADRGLESCILSDCTSGFDASFVTKALDMLCSYDGLFGYVGSSKELLRYVVEQTPPITPPAFDRDVSIAALRQQYRSRRAQPTIVVEDVVGRIEAYQSIDPAVFTHLEPRDQVLRTARELETRYEDQPLPLLYGVPFAVKDNIDVANVPTTAGSSAYTYTPTSTSPVVTAIIEAGGIFVGKTNLDQLATGLSGCRSPYGTPRSVYGRDRVSGGSSSGSAVAVAAKLVSFALGTDTAGSGRVPAAFNGIVGFKPTKGTFSAKGLVPACASLDTITILASTVDEAREIWLAADTGPDPSDPHSKPQSTLPLRHIDFRGPRNGGFIFGIPPASALLDLTPTYQTQFSSAITRLQKAGGTAKEIDWEPFSGANDLLYEGSLMHERIACLGPDFLSKNLETFEPAIRELYAKALARPTKPWEVFKDLHLQARYSRDAATLFDQEIDVLLVPTVVCHPTVAEMEKDPLALNARLGLFTHFGNVLDLCGIAVNAGWYEESDGKLPFGVTIVGGSGMDGRAFDIAREFERVEDA